MTATLADHLVQARQHGTALETIPHGLAPRDLAQAYRVADEVAARLGPAAGWKLGATSAGAQAMLGLAEPFRGPILAGTVLESPAAWRARRPVTCDAEIVFVLASSPASSDAGALRRAVGTVRLGLEINAPRWADPFALGALAIIADCGANAGLVLGPGVPRTQWDSLAGITVRLSQDARVAVGSGAEVLGDPWASLAVLVDMLARDGRSLAPGSVVASGNMAFMEAPPGQSVRADWGRHGRAAVTIEHARDQP